MSKVNRPKIKAKRRALAEKQKYQCAHCGQVAPLSVDHIIPLVAGGSNSLNNLQLLCLSCNKTKDLKPDRKRMGTIRDEARCRSDYVRWAIRWDVIKRWPVESVLDRTGKDVSELAIRAAKRINGDEQN